MRPRSSCSTSTGKPRATKCSLSNASSGDADHAAPRARAPARRRRTRSGVRCVGEEDQRLAPGAVDLGGERIGRQLGERDAAALDREVEQHDLVELVAVPELVDPVEQRLEVLRVTRREAGVHVRPSAHSHLGLLGDRRRARGARSGGSPCSAPTSQSKLPLSVVTFAAACMLTSTNWPRPRHVALRAAR